MCIIETRNLVKTYQSGSRTITAVNNISIQIPKGSILIIKGRSGSGKTTLLNLIGCLDYPTRGEVYLNGREVSSVPERELPLIRRHYLGFVFQRFHLLPTLTAIDNVMLPLKYCHLSNSDAKHRAVEVLTAVEMEERLSHYPGELSGGEQQRVAIARALANSPSVILADEPTGDLDTQTSLAIFELIKTLNETLGQTFLIVSHDELIMHYAKRIIQLKDGEIIHDTG